MPAGAPTAVLPQRIPTARVAWPVPMRAPASGMRQGHGIILWQGTPGDGLVLFANPQLIHCDFLQHIFQPQAFVFSLVAASQRCCAA